MFFNKEKKQIEALIALLDRLEFKIEALQRESSNTRFTH
jgi:hypothetical protein